MIVDLIPAKQLNLEDPLSGPAITSVAPSGVAKNAMSDRHHNNKHIPEKPYDYGIIHALRSSFVKMLLIKASVVYWHMHFPL